MLGSYRDSRSARPAQRLQPVGPRNDVVIGEDEQPPPATCSAPLSARFLPGSGWKTVTSGR
jgi:hypothetical protein